MTTSLSRSVEVRAVGGQALTFWYARQIAQRLLPLATDLSIEETHGMAQKGGAVCARIEFSLRQPREDSWRTLLLGLERIEGARGLLRLQPGDVAYICSECLQPPGALPDRAVPPPAIEELRRVAAQRQAALHLVNARLSSPWDVIQAAIDAGTLP